MKDNNTVLPNIIPLIATMPRSFDKIIYEYELRGKQPLGLSDCAIYSMAISEFCKRKVISIERYLREHSDKWHIHTKLYLIYSFLDVSITLKLKNVIELAQMADAAYIQAGYLSSIHPSQCRDLEFMHNYMQGWLLSDAIDNDDIKDNHKQEWLRTCLLSLKYLKKARRIAIMEDIDMPIREALLDLQIQTIHFGLVEPETKKGLTLGGINVLAYNHNIDSQYLRNSAESAYSYMVDIYKREKDSTIVRAYDFSPNVSLGL